MFIPIAVAVVVGVLGWAYQATKPPPPKICGSPDGPLVTSPRVRLSDGRHLAYRETGVSKEEAKYKIIVIHGFDSSKDLNLPASQEIIEELGIYFLFFDRAGYGDSDPNPKRSVKSEAFDIQELADKLQIGSKFYVLGVSMGAYPIWGCLKYIPNRLSGAALVVPFVHYWWPCFPSQLAKEAFKTLCVQDQWVFRVAYHAPWLFYWWMTQKWFPSLSIMTGNMSIFSQPDLEMLKKLSAIPSAGQEKIRQQGVHESLHRDIMAGYSRWEFDPLDINNPFPDNEGSVHIWQGYQDKIIPYKLNRYISEKLPWIRYHEVPEGGHLLIFDQKTCEDIIRGLLLGMLAVAALVLGVGVLVWAYQAVTPPPPKICGSPNGPPVTSPRIKLSDGRYLAYKERGVPKEQAKYKVILVHGFDSSKDIYLPLSQDLIDELGLYLVTYDRAGYGESDPNPKRSVKSEAFDLQELADQLELGPKFHVIGISIGTYSIWACLKYIPHRLAGVALVVPVINYWWPSFPSELFSKNYKKQLARDQWKLGIAHYTPGLTYWWLTQKWFPSSSILERHPIIFSKQDVEIIQTISKIPMPDEHKIRQQGVYESLHRDIMVHFGKWDFDPMELKNPFPNNEGSVHLWQGHKDSLVPFEMQRYLAQKLPWIQYHELPDSGHLIIHHNKLCEAIFRDAAVAAMVLGVAGVLWAHQKMKPPPPRICGSPNGPQVTSPRIKLRDGRHLAYQERGVPKEKAEYKAGWCDSGSSCHQLLVASFPSKLCSKAYKKQFARDQWQLRITHYAPDVRKVQQQSVHESLHRDLMVHSGKWDFDPMELKNPFPHNEGSVHLWQGMVLKTALVLLMGLLGLAYRATQPAHPESTELSDVPPTSSPRIMLSDGRYLAYKEKGVPKNESNYKIIIVHGFGSSKEMNFLAPQELIDELGIYFLLFDRAGYGESDLNPKRSVKSEAFDIQEVADRLELGSKFYVIGVSMGSYPTWSCLKHIPHRLAGVALVVPVINYSWPSLPHYLTREDYRKKLFPWVLWIANHAPGLLYWWVTQIWFPSSSSMERSPMFFSNRDIDILKKTSGFPMLSQDKIRQRGVFESLRHDFIVGFGDWDFDPMDLSNPFPQNESSVHIWQGYEDKVVPFQLQRYVAEKLPWIRYHEVPDGGHLIVHYQGLCEAILRALLIGEETPL
ncbi:hypothetical protein AAG906_038028 [Vitis piasezkii]